MGISYSSVVPWGRNLYEYIKMFNLTESDLHQKIISFGDGPASFNTEMYKTKNRIISLDPVYQFSKSQILERIKSTKNEVIEQVKDNMELFVWKNFKNLEELVETRMTAMTHFLEDFEKGKKQGRYIVHELPKQTNFSNQQFDLGLSSHFLLLYSNLGLEFHIKSIIEMLRICKEVRIFPIIDLNAKKSELLPEIIKQFETNYQINIQEADYEFQKDGNQMLTIENNKT